MGDVVGGFAVRAGDVIGGVFSDDVVGGFAAHVLGEIFVLVIVKEHLACGVR